MSLTVRDKWQNKNKSTYSLIIEGKLYCYARDDNILNRSKYYYQYHNDAEAGGFSLLFEKKKSTVINAELKMPAVNAQFDITLLGETAESWEHG